MNLTIWPAKSPAEKIWLTFNFTDELDTGETITNATVAVSLRTGTDATPGNLLDGAATIATNGRVMQKIKEGQHKANYLFICTATTSSGRVLELAAVLPVRTSF